MKILIVFYSLTGNTRKIAEAVASATSGEMMEIKTVKEIPTTGFMKFWVGGKQVVQRELPELLPFEKNPNDFDFIFLGTPIWAANFVPAVRSFLKQAKLQNKKIALFCIHGGDDPGQAFVNLEEELLGREIVGKIDFKMDAISEEQLLENLQKAAEWARHTLAK